MAITSAKAGDILVNNDPRKKGEQHIVIAVFSDCVKYRGNYRVSTVAFNRIFDDGKERSVGYNIKRS